MNCRDSESLILAERDGALTKAQGAALSDHVAACPACQRLRADLATALAAFKADIASVRVPDANAAWRDVQSRLHESALPARKRPLAIFRGENRNLFWFATPLAAAAAIAFAFLTNRTPSASSLPPPVAIASNALPLGPDDSIRDDTARADFVEAGDANASTMVYVDKDSGWLVVWATDAADTKTSG